ncbi:hypothetical protein [Algoriphagus sp. Y33]|uniref:hypothetical protein n=1 Tax=Algoriphagus sp. Y33 TaxID=2772483 RepID=UPI0017877927|nr:hypothetical protein [Algoriphagus sp. Y33]
MYVLNVSNLNNLSFSHENPNLQKNASQICGLLIKSLEIRRRVITFISGEWESDEELFAELQESFN